MSNNPTASEINNAISLSHSGLRCTLADLYNDVMSRPGRVGAPRVYFSDFFNHFSMQIEKVNSGYKVSCLFNNQPVEHFQNKRFPGGELIGWVMLNAAGASNLAINEFFPGLTQVNESLFEVARRERNFLALSQAKDGYQVGDMNFDLGDDEINFFFEVEVSGKTASFNYSMGFDQDAQAYFPFVEVVGGTAVNPAEFTFKKYGGIEPIKNDVDLLLSVSHLSLGCGEARAALFNWLNNEDVPVLDAPSN